MNKITTKSIVIYGVVIPVIWALFILFIYNPRLIGSASFPELMKSLVSIVNLVFSPLGAIAIALIYSRKGESNKNLFILATLFFIVTLIFHLYNFMYGCRSIGGC